MEYLAPQKIQKTIPQIMVGHQLEQLKGLAQNADKLGKDKQLKELARQFESILMHQMLSSMRSTVQKSKLFDSYTMETYESMLDQEIANEMSKDRGIGLADMLYYELRRKADIEETSQTQGLEDNAFSIRGD